LKNIQESPLDQKQNHPFSSLIINIYLFRYTQYKYTIQRIDLGKRERGKKKQGSIVID
jgi:hypothetical protein